MDFACQSIGIPKATVYRSLTSKPVQSKSSVVRKVARAIPKEERMEIVRTLNSELFVDKSPYEIHSTLLDKQKYLCSARTMYRILHECDQVRESRNIVQRSQYKKPELLTRSSNTLWSWDITKLRTTQKWTYFYLYVLMDVFSCYVVGWLIADKENGCACKTAYF